jgi:hypothetical protein
VKQAFTPDLSLSLSLPKFGITKLMRLQKWGGYPTKLTTTFAFSTLFFYSSSLESTSIFQMLSFPKSFAGSSERRSLSWRTKFGISRSFAVHISYIKSKDTSPFTYYLKFPSPNTVTQPSADRFMSCTCTYKSTTGTCSFPRERTDERPNSHVIASHRSSRR